MTAGSCPKQANGHRYRAWLGVALLDDDDVWSPSWPPLAVAVLSTVTIGSCRHECWCWAGRPATDVAAAAHQTWKSVAGTCFVSTDSGSVTLNLQTSTLMLSDRSGPLRRWGGPADVRDGRAG